MRSLLTLLLFCVCLSAAVAQSAARKKVSTTAKQSTAAAKAAAQKKAAAAKAAATPRPKPALPPAEPAASTLTFPSTEPENAATLDAQKKQQMYDELHGVKAQSTTPDTRGRRGSQRMASNASGEAGTYIGVRVGGNYTTFLQRTQIADGLGSFINTTPSNYFGFHAGVVFQFGRGAVAFQPEINFQQDYLKLFTLTPGETRTYTTSSLVVPLLAKFQFGQPGDTRLFVNVGPYGTYSLDSRNSQTIIGYGGALGVGVGIPAGPGKVTVEARTYYALGATNSNINFGDVPNKPLVNQLSVGYLFPLGGR